MTRARLLLISSSVVHGYGFLDQPEPFIREHFGAARTIAFVPFAAHDHEAYTQKVRERFGEMGFEIVPVEQLDRAEGVFVGGGNTFRLLKTLYARSLLEPLRARVRGGIPYCGSSAGTVLTCPTIRTTNDMPIVFPPSLDALALVPFQINCHYLDPDDHSTHKGETREERLREFHEENDVAVIGLREGSCLRVADGSVTLLGSNTAWIFRRGEAAVEVEPGDGAGRLLPGG